MTRVLHVGCGGEQLPEWLMLGDIVETRLDVDETHSPDIVASMTDMGEIGEYDLLYSCHALEHLAPHDVHKAVSEFHRVLRTGGAAVIVVPDLEGVAPTDEVMYTAAAGPVTGRDMIYGMARLVEQNPWMAHKTGFVSDTLKQTLSVFSDVSIKKVPSCNLIGVAVK